MAPERKYPQMSKQEMIEKIRKLAEELGRSPSQADMKRAGVPWHRIYSQFGGMRQAVRAAGLEPGPRGEALNEGAMILDWAGVVRKLRRLPSRAEYDRLGKHHSGTLHARLDWSQMAHRFVLLVREFHLEDEWADVVSVVVKRYPLLRLPELPVVPKLPRLENQTHHGDTETRRTEDFTAEDAESAEENLNGLPLINADHTDQSMARDFLSPEGDEAMAVDRRPVWMKLMRLKRLVPAALAIQILMATAAKGATGTWQLAVSQNKTTLTATDANGAKEPPQVLPLISTDHTDQSRARDFLSPEGDEAMAVDRRPVWMKLMRLKRLVPAALAIQILMATASGAQPRAAVPHDSIAEPVVYGAPIGLAAMAHAPTNEGGVMFLFGVLAERLGFRVERIQTAYPDCEAKREVRPGVWERVRVELEYESRNFKEHRHDLRGCDVIVCWRHNWPECPRGIEVVELSRHVG